MALFETFAKNLFFSHEFGYRHASKSIKGSKDSYWSQECKKYLGQKMAHLAGAQSQET